MGKQDHPSARYADTTLRGHFSVYLSAEEYAYVIAFAKAHNVTRNKAVNEIIAEHATWEARRQARRLRAAR